MNAQKILIIEDEFDIAQLIKHRLELEGYRVITAADGEDGLAQFIKERPDLILLDLNLPKINGYEVCRRIRRDQHDDTPILMLTSKSEITDRIIGRVKGADCYMFKPFEAGQLLKEIKSLLETANDQ